MPYVSNRVNCVCKACNKEFSIPASQFKKGGGKYCGAKCQRNVKGENHPNWKDGGVVDAICLNCNNKFPANKSFLKIGKEKFCCKKCSSAYFGKKNHIENTVVKSCKICSKEYRVKKSHSHKAGVYCSIECMTIGYRERMIGESNPNYKAAGYENYSKVSEKRRELRKEANKIKSHSHKEWLTLKASYDHRCAKCKKKEPKIKLTKDHIIPITKGGHNGIDNIQPLCQRCNVKKFTKTEKYVHQLLIVYPN